MTSFLILLASLFSMGQGGIVTGNGGDVIICPADHPTEPPVQFLDSYEAKIEGLKLIAANGNDYLEIAESLVKKSVSPVYPGIASTWIDRIRRFEKIAIFQDNISLAEIEDSHQIALPKDCRIKQIAVRRAVLLPRLKPIRIDNRLFKLLPPLEQAHLVIHEIINEDMREGIADSTGVRLLVGMIASDEIAGLFFNDESAMHFFRKIGFKWYEKTGVIFRVPPIFKICKGITKTEGGIPILLEADAEIPSKDCVFFQNGELVFFISKNSISTYQPNQMKILSSSPVAAFFYSEKKKGELFQSTLILAQPGVKSYFDGDDKKMIKFSFKIENVKPGLDLYLNPRVVLQGKDMIFGLKIPGYYSMLVFGRSEKNSTYLPSRVVRFTEKLERILLQVRPGTSLQARFLNRSNDTLASHFLGLSFDSCDFPFCWLATSEIINSNDFGKAIDEDQICQKREKITRNLLKSVSWGVLELKGKTLWKSKTSSRIFKLFPNAAQHIHTACTANGASRSVIDVSTEVRDYRSRQFGDFTFGVGGKNSLVLLHSSGHPKKIGPHYNPALELERNKQFNKNVKLHSGPNRVHFNSEGLLTQLSDGEFTLVKYPKVGRFEGDLYFNDDLTVSGYQKKGEKRVNFP